MTQTETLSPTRIMEIKVITAALKSIFEAGHIVSVYDGEEWTLRCSSNFDEVMGALFTTDEDMIRVLTASGHRVGDIDLVYGNDGYDVISDHTANEFMNHILVEATRVSLQLSH